MKARPKSTSKRPAALTPQEAISRAAAPGGVQTRAGGSGDFAPTLQPVSSRDPAAPKKNEAPLAEESRPFGFLTQENWREKLRDWRQFYNPFRWLTPAVLQTLFDQGDRGDFPRLQWLYRYAERRYYVLKAVKDRRLAAIAKLDWKIIPKDDSPAATAQTEELKVFFGKIRHLRKAWRHLATATFRGYAHLQILTDSTGYVVGLAPIPQWHFRREGLYGPWKFCATEGDAGTPLDPTGFVVREVEEPLNEIATETMVSALFGWADYCSFIEDFGDPSVFLELPPNVPANKEAEFRAMITKALGGLRAAVPSGTKPHTFGGEVRSTDIFDKHIAQCESRIITAATGGKLTMMQAGGGLGNGAADVQDKAFDDLASAEAREISEVFNAALAEPWLRAEFPGQPILAEFAIEATEEEDRAAAAELAAKVKQIGYQPTRQWTQARTGVELVESPDPAEPPAAAPTYHTSAATISAPAAVPDLADQRREILRALAADYDPIRELTQQLIGQEEITPADLERLQTALETADTAASERAWESLHAAAALTGWAENPSIVS